MLHRADEMENWDGLYHEALRYHLCANFQDLGLVAFHPEWIIRAQSEAVQLSIFAIEQIRKGCVTLVGR